MFFDISFGTEEIKTCTIHVSRDSVFKLRYSPKAALMYPKNWPLRNLPNMKLESSSF